MSSEENRITRMTRLELEAAEVERLRRQGRRLAILLLQLGDEDAIEEAKQFLALHPDEEP